MAEITSHVNTPPPLRRPPSPPHPPPPPPPPPQERHPISYQPNDNYWDKYLNYQSDWLERTRGNLMVVATVIATMSLQIAVNPPGGVWQTNAKFEDGCPIAPKQTCNAGTSVLSYTHHDTYIYLIYCSTVSFSASLSIILLLTSGFPLKNKLMLGILMISMSLAVLSMAGSFMISVILVRGGHDDAISNIAVYYGVFWLGLLVVLILYHLVQLLIWLLRKLVEGVIWVVKMIFSRFG